MSESLEGRVALVIGAARGIGAASRNASSRRAPRLSSADTEAEGAATAERLGGPGVARFVPPTYRTSPTPRRSLRMQSTAFGRLDIIVQNAGIYPWTLIEDISPEEWDRVLAVNLKGCFLAARAALPMMRKAARPHDLHLLDHRPARDEPRPRPLFGEQSRHQRLHPRRRARILRLRHHRQRRRAGQHSHRGHEAAPQRRLHQSMEDVSRSAASARPRDVANAVLFLASDEADYITGTTILVDGGQMLPEGADFRIRPG